MEDERLYELMMESLDGILDAEESAELAYLLSQNPDAAAEWEAMQAVDELFRFADPAPAPLHFSQMTIARLPNPRNRRLFMALFYFALLVGGLTPVAVGLSLSSQLGSFTIGTGQTLRVLQAIFDGLFTATSSGLAAQPYLVSWLAILVGVIMLWLTVYRRAINEVRLVPATA